MAKLTNRQRLINGLIGAGWTRDENARTSKYVVFSKQSTTEKMFVGKSGALRIGMNATASRSLEHSPLRKIFLELGETNGTHAREIA